MSGDGVPEAALHREYDYRCESDNQRTSYDHQGHEQTVVDYARIMGCEHHLSIPVRHSGDYRVVGGGEQPGQLVIRRVLLCPQLMVRCKPWRFQVLRLVRG